MKRKVTLSVLLALAWMSYVEAGRQQEEKKDALETQQEAKLLSQPIPQSGAQGEVKIKLFFPKTEFQNPEKTVPNWYYYWSNTACSFIRGSSYPWGGGSYDSGTYAEYNGNWSNTVYTIYNHATGAEKYNYSYGGVNLNIDRKGIDTLEATLEHEREHQRTDEKWLSPTGVWKGKTDTDGDELPDDWENEHASFGFDPNNSYSFPNFLYGDDEEVWCELQAKGKKGNASQNWAWPGKQSDPPY